MSKYEDYNVEALRSLCRQANIEPGWYKNGRSGVARAWLSRSEMEAVLDRVELKRRGQQLWLPPGCVLPKASLVAHAFWVDAKAMTPNASTVESELPGFGQLGIASACKAGLSVVLWTYGNLGKVPWGYGRLRVEDASALLPKEQALAYLQRGMRIQHLADYVRLLAVKQHHEQQRLIGAKRVMRRTVRTYVRTCVQYTLIRVQTCTHVRTRVRTHAITHARANSCVGRSRFGVASGMWPMVVSQCVLGNDGVANGRWPMMCFARWFSGNGCAAHGHWSMMIRTYVRTCVSARMPCMSEACVTKFV